jgi:hypothetical protein
MNDDQAGLAPTPLRLGAMTSRRDLLRLSALGSAAVLLPGCGSSGYEAVVAETWRHGPAPPTEPGALQRELVRYATLAANSHNTQPWQFALGNEAITIRPDPARRTPAVDPDDHHLWVSLGCATENLVLAAAAFGRRAEAAFDPRNDAVVVALTPMAPVRSPLFAAIPRRQCTRAEYDGQSLPAAELRALESTASGPGVRILLLTDRPRLDAVADFVTQGNSVQFRDPAFLRELKHWIRFSDGEAIATRDGLAARASGNPSVPRWFGDLIFGLAVSEKSENDKIVRQLRSSAGVAVFVAAGDSHAHWIEVGRAYQRLALLAASLGIRNAFLNQPVEVPALRTQFAQWLGLGTARLDLVVRFGRGPLLPQSLRRPVEAVLATGGVRTA